MERGTDKEEIAENELQEKIRKPVKLNMKQGLIMNQVLNTYALNDVNNSLCRDHINEFKLGLRALEPWAVKSKFLVFRCVFFLSGKINSQHLKFTKLLTLNIKPVGIKHTSRSQKTKYTTFPRIAIKRLILGLLSQDFSCVLV